MSVPLPASVTAQIARDAVIIAQSLAPRDTGAGALNLQPISADGMVGIRGPEYMLMQNSGFDPFVMESLAGKTVPIRTPGGGINFRTAVPDKIGAPRIISRDERGVIHTKRMWTHPGLKGSRFIEEGLNQAINNWNSSVTSAGLVSVLKQTDYRELIDVLEMVSMTVVQ